MSPQGTRVHRYGLHLLMVLALLAPRTGTIRAAQEQAADMGNAYMTAVTHVATTVMPAVVQLTMTAQPGVAQPVPADSASSARHAFRTPALPKQFNPTLTPARYIKGRTVDKIMTCGIFA